MQNRRRREIDGPLGDENPPRPSASGAPPQRSRSTRPECRRNARPTAERMSVPRGRVASRWAREGARWRQRPSRRPRRVPVGAGGSMAAWSIANRGSEDAMGRRRPGPRAGRGSRGFQSAVRRIRRERSKASAPSSPLPPLPGTRGPAPTTAPAGPDRKRRGLRTSRRCPVTILRTAQERGTMRREPRKGP